jgi:hypothetical protein
MCGTFFSNATQVLAQGCMCQCTSIELTTLACCLSKGAIAAEQAIALKRC